ncbi:MAG: hypothetical protein EHM23_06475 [Acidobacteria bacterium]|nr:MAG: hypothetical protein EHM23_06475 [Acidobacteriota bacterium]
MAIVRYALLTCLILAAVALGKIYVVGNLGGDARVLEYDPGADRWAIKAPMLTPRFDFGITPARD